MGHHIVNGEFKSDKYEWCKKGFLALKFSDPNARDPLLLYADRTKDQELSEDIKTACQNEIDLPAKEKIHNAILSLDKLIKDLDDRGEGDAVEDLMAVRRILEPPL